MFQPQNFIRNNILLNKIHTSPYRDKRRPDGAQYSSSPLVNLFSIIKSKRIIATNAIRVIKKSPKLVSFHFFWVWTEQSSTLNLNDNSSTTQCLCCSVHAKFRQLSSNIEHINNFVENWDPGLCTRLVYWTAYFCYNIVGIYWLENDY